jgi:hypothetical protein
LSLGNNEISFYCDRAEEFGGGGGGPGIGPLQRGILREGDFSGGEVGELGCIGDGGRTPLLLGEDKK